MQASAFKASPDQLTCVRGHTTTPYLRQRADGTMQRNCRECTKERHRAYQHRITVTDYRRQGGTGRKTVQEALCITCGDTGALDGRTCPDCMEANS